MIVRCHDAIIGVIMLSCVIVNCEIIKNSNTMIKKSHDVEDRLLNTSLNRELAKENEFESRKEKSSEDKQNLLTRILPMLAMPFIMQSIFLPMVLLGIKFMLIQSIFMGKMAIIFWTVNLIRNKIQDQQGQFYSHNVHLPHD